MTTSGTAEDDFRGAVPGSAVDFVRTKRVWSHVVYIAPLRGPETEVVIRITDRRPAPLEG